MDRWQWIFPHVPDSLDPAREEDRAVLVGADHSELARAPESDEVELASRPVNPRFHLSMHQVVANQVWADDPPEVWQAAQRLVSDGFDRHDVLHMLIWAVAPQIVKTLGEGTGFDMDAYRSALGSLPGSWLGERDGQGDDQVPGTRLRGAALDVLAAQGPLSAEALAVRLGVGVADLHGLEEDLRVTKLGDERLASVLGLLSNTVLTHHLSAAEARTEHLGLTVDTAPLIALVCGDDHIHLPDGEVATFDGWLEEDIGEPTLSGDTLIKGPPGWLAGATEGAPVGLRLVANDSSRRHELGFAAFLEVVTPGEPAPIPDTFAAQLRASLDSFGDRDRDGDADGEGYTDEDGKAMPVPVATLVGQLAADAPYLVRGTLAPISELLAAGRFEVVDGYAGPEGTDWDSFRRLMRVARTATTSGLDENGTAALILVCDLVIIFDRDHGSLVPREIARLVGEVLRDPSLGEALAEALDDRPDTTMDFLAKSRLVAGHRHTADLAWVEALVASRSGALARAEACLQIGLGADPAHGELLEDHAWYASDRGDARLALRYLGRIETGGGSEPIRSGLLRPYVSSDPSGAPPGRNDPCTCGSGRKFKHCCLGSAGEVSLPPLSERVAWLWGKLVWWLERAGPHKQALYAASILQGAAREEIDDKSILVDLDIADSLVLFEDGAIDRFIAQRAGLLPDDEAALLGRWASTRGALYEVAEVRPGRGLDLRKPGSAETIAVTECQACGGRETGQLIFAHLVPDGLGHQFVGGIVPVDPTRRDDLVEALDGEVTSRSLALVFGDLRQSC